MTPTTTATKTPLCAKCWERMKDNPNLADYWFEAGPGEGCQIHDPAPRTGTAEISRKYQCVECGHRHQDGVTVTVEWDLDQDGNEVRKAGTFSGWFTCDECYTEQVINIRITKGEVA